MRPYLNPSIALVLEEIVLISLVLFITIASML